MGSGKANSEPEHAAFETRKAGEQHVYDDWQGRR